MVLNPINIKAFPVWLMALILLNACSHYSVKPADSRGKIIPAQVEELEIPTLSNTAATKEHIPQAKISKQTKTQNDTSNKNIQAVSPPVPLDIPLIEMLLEKAKKAMSLQQWFRAQRSLEQAIRLEPNNASIFLLYGNVYDQLGIPEQAINMFTRARYLAQENNEEVIFEAAQEKLSELSIDTMEKN